MVSGNAAPRPNGPGRFYVADGRDRYQGGRRAAPPSSGRILAGDGLALVTVQFIVAQEPSRRTAEVRSTIVSESGQTRKSRETVPPEIFRAAERGVGSEFNLQVALFKR